MAEGTPIIIKKIKKSHGGHHGGSWKVAYADFVTAMMAFFMVMWIMGMSDQSRAQIQGYFNDPMGWDKNQPKFQSVIPIKGSPKANPGNTNKPYDDPNKAEEDAARELEQKVKRAVEGIADLKGLSKNVHLSVDGDGLHIELAEAAGAVFFQSGSSVIREETRQLIKAIAPVLTKSDRRMIVEGHTDAQPYPSETYTNWDLSADRAKALRLALTQYGVPVDRFLEIRGMGSTRLKVPDQPRHFSNRRVTLLLPFAIQSDSVAELPKSMFKHEIQGAFRQDIGLVENPGPMPEPVSLEKKPQLQGGESRHAGER